MSVATLSVSMEQRRDVSRHQRARTSRCLFDPPNMDDLQKKYEEQSREQMCRFREKWGFDPEKDSPVQGHDRFQWEPVQPEVKKEEPSPEQGAAEETSQSPENTTRPLKQTSMKDFYPERKRSGETSSLAAVIGKKPRLSSDGSSSDETYSNSSSSQQVN